MQGLPDDLVLLLLEKVGEWSNLFSVAAINALYRRIFHRSFLPSRAVFDALKNRPPDFYQLQDVTAASLDFHESEDFKNAACYRIPPPSAIRYLLSFYSPERLQFVSLYRAVLDDSFFEWLSPRFPHIRYLNLAGGWGHPGLSGAAAHSLQILHPTFFGAEYLHGPESFGEALPGLLACWAPQLRHLALPHHFGAVQFATALSASSFPAMESLAFGSAVEVRTLPSALRTLELTTCCFHAAAVADLVKTAPLLESLTIDTSTTALITILTELPRLRKLEAGLFLPDDNPASDEEPFPNFTRVEATQLRLLLPLLRSLSRRLHQGSLRQLHLHAEQPWAATHAALLTLALSIDISEPSRVPLDSMMTQLLSGSPSGQAAPCPSCWLDPEVGPVSPLEELVFDGELSLDAKVLSFLATHCRRHLRVLQLREVHMLSALGLDAGAPPLVSLRKLFVGGLPDDATDWLISRAPQLAELRVEADDPELISQAIAAPSPLSTTQRLVHLGLHGAARLAENLPGPGMFQSLRELRWCFPGDSSRTPSPAILLGILRECSLFTIGIDLTVPGPLIAQMMQALSGRSAATLSRAELNLGKLTETHVQTLLRGCPRLIDLALFRAKCLRAGVVDTILDDGRSLEYLWVAGVRLVEWPQVLPLANHATLRTLTWNLESPENSASMSHTLELFLEACGGRMEPDFSVGDGYE
ncbi:hypothetical protein PAPYR_3387 [Paratrimastix pyriformis]|uniref:F-box domain-containing protein n=1 Tax=Paratrimastix pyriformis TaxID=342808 RepID=A0ABQ8UPH7_9EUKA|nr:hypothetical protein PAPYR_3387 [Paratrimastix pyriformis]